MNDLISRRDAIIAASNAVDEWDGGSNERRYDMIASAVNTLPHAQQWTQVTDALPTKYGNYLVTMRNDAFDYCIVDIAIFGIKDGRWSSCDADGFYFVGEKGMKVLAWMPLPEPYKMVGEDG